MAQYSRIQDGQAVEIITLPDDVALKDAFHPDIVAQCVPIETIQQADVVPPEKGVKK